VKEVKQGILHGAIIYKNLIFLVLVYSYVKFRYLHNSINIEKENRMLLCLVL